MKPSLHSRAIGVLGTVAALLFSSLPAFAQEAAAAPPTIDSGDTAWLLVSTVLVLMMTIPGLALFYGGMVRKKNVLTTTAMVFVSVAVLSVVWMLVG